MIRTITPDDSSAVISLAVLSGLFPADDTAVLDTMLANYFERGQTEGHQCIIDVDLAPIGVAYFLPKAATDRTWELLLIAIKGDIQGQGHGTILLKYIEETLRSNGQRLLLVETSGLTSFERTRKFYFKCGYEQEARVRDYYATGEDMILFRKQLVHNNV